MTKKEIIKKLKQISSLCWNFGDAQAIEAIDEAIEILEKDDISCVGCIHRHEEGHYCCKMCKRSMGDFYEVKNEDIEDTDGV